MHAPLVEVVRGELVESVHFGSLVMLSADGEVEYSLGEVETTMFPRSANKLLQAAGVLELGADLTSEQIAISASSHSGGDIHAEVVMGLLDAFGLHESDLQNTPGFPIGAAERKQYLKAGGQRSSLRADCSGKHASFLAACKVNGWETADYLDPQHPLQQRLMQVMSRETAVDVAMTGVDGCGAPLWSSTLVGLARAYGRAAGGAGATVGKVADAMRSRPDLVAGPGREPTAAMLALPGVIAKDGAEGVFALGHPDGRAAAFKIADGSKRAMAPLAKQVLRLWGAQEAALAAFEEVPVLGGGKPAGRLQLAPSAFPERH